MQRRGPVPGGAAAQMRRGHGPRGALAQDVAVFADPGMGSMEGPRMMDGSGMDDGIGDVYGTYNIL